MPHHLFDTDLGPCAIAWSDAGVTALQLPEETRAATVARLVARTPGAEDASPPPAWVRAAVAKLEAHLSGRPQDLSRIELDLSRTTDYAAAIYRALQRVPAGRTTTYGELAAAAGRPGTARAVGRAMATNPLALLVPCHRVVGARGGGGFSAYGGVVTKEQLLAREGIALREQRALLGRARPLPFDGEEATRHLAAKDAPLGKHIAKVGPLRLELEATEGTFAALAESIVYQQLSGKAAATIFGRVRALYPERALEPSRVLATPDADLRGAGLSAAKLASLRDLATRATCGEIPTLPELDRLDDEAIIDRLTAVRGVGRWTVEMLLIFRLGRPDVLPVTDYGVKKGFAKVFARPRGGELPSAEELERRAERWRPFRSVASWYLWRALDT